MAKTKKEQFKQFSIFDQMRFGAQDAIDSAKKQVEDEERALAECRDYNDRLEYGRDVKNAEKKLDAALKQYSKVVDEIKEFEK